jgi:hypothetical protein
MGGPPPLKPQQQQAQAGRGKKASKPTAANARIMQLNAAIGMSAKRNDVRSALDAYEEAEVLTAQAAVQGQVVEGAVLNSGQASGGIAGCRLPVPLNALNTLMYLVVGGDGWEVLARCGGGRGGVDGLDTHAVAVHNINPAAAALPDIAAEAAAKDAEAIASVKVRSSCRLSEKG